MIERNLRRHRTARLFGSVGCLLLCGRWTWLTSRGMPLAASARVYGAPRDVLRRIDAEIAAGRDVRIFGDWNGWRLWAAPDLVVFTPTWLVQVNAAGVSAVRLDDILWVFKR